jgi:hypothetical protein
MTVQEAIRLSLRINRITSTEEFQYWNYNYQRINICKIHNLWGARDKVQEMRVDYTIGLLNPKPYPSHHYLPYTLYRRMCRSPTLSSAISLWISDYPRIGVLSTEENPYQRSKLERNLYHESIRLQSTRT